MKSELEHALLAAFVELHRQNCANWEEKWPESWKAVEETSKDLTELLEAKGVRVGTDDSSHRHWLELRAKARDTFAAKLISEASPRAFPDAYVNERVRILLEGWDTDFPKPGEPQKDPIDS